MIRLIFTEEMRERLRHERIHHPHPRVRQRLEALYLKSDGLIASGDLRERGHHQADPDWLPAVVSERGLDGADDLPVPPGPRRLAPHEGVIVAAFARHPPATLAEARTRITELTGIERSPAQVGKVLKQFGPRRRKTGAMPGPARPTNAGRNRPPSRRRR